jgi:hypothetical protein
MHTEEQFVGLERPHVSAGKKQLLYSEMEILTSLKKYNNYMKFRKESLALKNLLKKVINELNKEMEILLEYIPKVKVEELKPKEIKEKPKPIPPVKRDALEEEIQKIRSKIAMLGN